MKNLIKKIYFPMPTKVSSYLESRIIEQVETKFFYSMAEHEYRSKVRNNIKNRLK